MRVTGEELVELVATRAERDRLRDDLKAAREELEKVRTERDGLADLTADIIREETRLYVDEDPLAKCVHCKRADIPKATLDHWKECENHPARALQAENDAMAALLERVYVETTFVGGCQPSVESSERMRAILAARSKRMGAPAPTGKL